MALFSSNFSFEAPSTRPESHYTYGTALDNVSPTSSRCGSPSSPSSASTPSTSSSSSTDDLYGLTSHLSTSSLYNSSSRFLPPGRRSPPRSTPFSLPPNFAQQQNQTSVDMLARRERRQAYVSEQLSSQSRRKLSLLVARMLGDEIVGGSRKHPNDGLHPSNVRVVPAMPGNSKSRRNTLAEVRRTSNDDEGEDTMGASSGDDYGYDGLSPENVCESIEMDLPVRQKESSNRISKRSLGRSSGRKVSSRPKK